MFSGDLKSMFFIQFTNYIHIWYRNKFAKLLIRSNTGIDGILVISYTGIYSPRHIPSR